MEKRRRCTIAWITVHMIRKNNCTTKTVQKWPKWSNWSLISDQAAKRDLWCWKEGETSMKALYASLTKQMERIQDWFINILTSRSNSSSVWICLRVSIVSSSFDNSRTAPNCFRASSALDPLFSLMTVTTQNIRMSSKCITKTLTEERGVLGGCALHTVQADCPSDRLNGWVPPPPVQRHMLSPNLCCHPLTKSALWSIKLVKTSDGVFNVEVLHPSGWPFCTLP